MNPSRRTFLGNLALGAAVAPLLGVGRLMAQDAKKKDDAGAADDGRAAWGGFKMGMQSYSVRVLKTPEKAVAAYHDLGLRFAEFYPGNLPMSADPAVQKAYLRTFQEAGVTLLAYGVMGFKKGDEAGARKIFDFAKAMGIRMISADPEPESIDFVEKLVKEYDITVGIHNHGPKARYDGLDTVLKAVEGRDVRFGACVDAGHTLRSGENPVKWIEKLGERVHGCHLKDVKGSKDQAKFTKLGQGDLDVAGVLKGLKAAKFDGCLSLEYEESEQDPIQDIKECLEFVKETLKKL